MSEYIEGISDPKDNPLIKQHEAAVAVAETDAGAEYKNTHEYAKLLSGATYVPAAYRNNPANLALLIEYAKGFNLHPAQVLGGKSVYIITEGKSAGKAGTYVSFLLGRARAAGHRIWWESKYDDTGAVIQSVTAYGKRRDELELEVNENIPAQLYQYTFTRQHAELAGYMKRTQYQINPENMFFKRAVGTLIDRMCPEVTSGLSIDHSDAGDWDGEYTTPDSGRLVSGGINASVSSIGLDTTPKLDPLSTVDTVSETPEPEQKPKPKPKRARRTQAQIKADKEAEAKAAALLSDSDKANEEQSDTAVDDIPYAEIVSETEETTAWDDTVRDDFSEFLTPGGVGSPGESVIQNTASEPEPAPEPAPAQTQSPATDLDAFTALLEQQIAADSDFINS